MPVAVPNVEGHVAANQAGGIDVCAAAVEHGTFGRLWWAHLSQAL